ncbi:site-2 protease family protein [Thermodesulfobacteriota bacterium]
MTPAKPKFRPEIIIRRFEEKGGGFSIVLEDPVANKFFRISQYEFELLRVLDGKLTIPEAIERARLRGRHFTEEHAGRLLDQFSRAGLLLNTVYGTSAAQLKLKEGFDKAMRKASAVKVYFLYLPLINPDRFLDRTIWLWRLLVNRITAAITAALIPGAIYLLLSQINRLHNEFLYFFNLSNLLVLWIAIALVKLIHEFSHAYTAKNLGLRVPEMGIALLLFFPCLYCNTTTAWQLADRKQRVAIALAGILAEATLAIISVYVWSFSKPGLLNSVAFFLMAVSLISSIMFNGNPLLKFDGYFVLTDWLRMPNLQTNAFAYLKHLFVERVLGIQGPPLRTLGGKERSIYAVYGVSAFIYRFFLYTGIVAGVYYRFDKTIGLILAAAAFFLFVVRPVSKGIVFLVTRRSDMSFRPVGLAVFGLIMLSGFFLLTHPWSNNSVYPCYVNSTVVRQITLPAEASVKKVNVRQGDRVRAGDTILKMNPVRLEFELRYKESEAALLKAEISLIENMGTDLAKLRLKLIELSQTRDDVRRIKNELNNLVWFAPFDGVVTRLQQTVQPGFLPGKGTVVGELASDTDCEILGLVPQLDISRILPGSQVEVWFPFGSGVSFHLKVSQVNPFNSEDLEGSPFSSRFGGEIATRLDDRSGKKDSPISAQYLVRIDFSDNRQIPLGATGRLVVNRPPRSALERMVDFAYKTFHRESVF